MFALNLRTPTARSYDPRPEVEAALRRVVLEPGQQAVMCNACGCWWVADEHEYPKYDGRHYPRIPSCPHCDIARRKPGGKARHS